MEVFYDEDAFADEEGNTQEVVLKANRLLKQEETEKEGEKLTEEQVEAMRSTRFMKAPTHWIFAL